MTERQTLEKLLLSDPDMLLLCDPGEAKHVCRLLVDSPAPLGVSLGPLVIEPLTKIINVTKASSEIHHEAFELREHVEILVSLIKMNPESASEFSEKLRLLWMTFIAAMSASRVYHDLPKTRAQKKKAAKLPRPGRIDPMREKIKTVLSSRRNDNCTLVQVLNDWGLNRIGSLRLTYLGGCKYQFDDEDSVDGIEQIYSLRALRKLWTQAGGN